jgi:predicted nucleic acid-binding protein
LARLLADTSAWHWSGRVADRWEALLQDDELATCTPVALELLFSARGPVDHRLLASDLDALPRIAQDARSEQIARSTQAALAERGQHRGATPIDVLVAALAAANGLVLIHYDRHFDVIARVTGQPTEWLARRGSLD